MLPENPGEKLNSKVVAIICLYNPTQTHTYI